MVALGDAAGVWALQMHQKSENTPRANAIVLNRGVMGSNGIIEPRAAIYLQMPHRRAGFVHGVSRSDLALHAPLNKRIIWFDGKGLRQVKRAGATCAGVFHDVEVKPGGGDIAKAGQVLDGSDADAAFEEGGRLFSLFAARGSVLCSPEVGVSFAGIGRLVFR